MIHIYNEHYIYNVRIKEKKDKKEPTIGKEVFG